MNCYFHTDRAAEQRCDKCAQVFCYDCVVGFEGRSVCRSCVRKALDSDGRGASRVKYPHTRSSNLLIVFLLASIPGTAYMYMGLMKRGLLVLSSLFMAFWLMSVTRGAPLFGFVIAIMYITSFFDSLHIRKRIILGEYVEDNISDITGFFGRNKLVKYIAGFLLLAALFSGGVFGRSCPVVFSSLRMFDYSFPTLVLMAIIGFIIYSLFKGKKRKTPSEEVVDKRPGRDEQY